MSKKTLPPLYLLLDGIARINYANEKEISIATFKDELYPSMSADEFHTFVNKMTNLLKSIVTSNMDFNQLDAFLTSQMKRKECGISEDEATIFGKFWKDQKMQIHKNILNSVCWNNTLADVNWRIDVKTQSKGKDVINIPTAILKLQLHNSHSDEDEQLQFEMDEKKLAETLSVFDEIQTRISTLCQHNQ